MLLFHFIEYMEMLIRHYCNTVDSQYLHRGILEKGSEISHTGKYT